MRRRIDRKKNKKKRKKEKKKKRKISERCFYIAHLIKLLNNNLNKNMKRMNEVSRN